MAKSNGVNKSKAIRDYFKTHPKAKTSEVVEALAKNGVPVTGNYVSNLKTKHNTRRRAVRKVVAKGGVGIPQLKVALELIKLTGSVKAATQALAVAQEIRAIV
jgi:tRNA A37 threonylcarbamoyladenosine synthetase subunit TsaC/SUA5/YrdC